ncbi:hypothetical protein A1WM_00241 [Escherichia coli KTE101]|nr:hypothetical protein A1WM_00241 [Escherichia coli KTE101]
MSTGLRFTLEVDGLPPDAFAVVSFHLTQSLSSLFSLDLSLVSQQFLSLEFAQVLDKMAYLTVWQGDDVQRRVKGVVTWWICPYISRHLLSLNPLQARCRRYSRGER